MYFVGAGRKYSEPGMMRGRVFNKFDSMTAFVVRSRMNNTIGKHWFFVYNTETQLWDHIDDMEAHARSVAA